MVKDEVVGGTPPPEPIDKLNEPKTRKVRRLSFYFVGGTAQDFNIYDGDTLNIKDKAFYIERDSGVLEIVNKDHVAWMRDQTLTVKVRDREKKPE